MHVNPGWKKSASWQLVAVIKGSKTTQSFKNCRNQPNKKENSPKTVSVIFGYHRCSGMMFLHVLKVNSEKLYIRE